MDAAISAETAVGAFVPSEEGGAAFAFAVGVTFAKEECFAGAIGELLEAGIFGGVAIGGAAIGKGVPIGQVVGRAPLAIVNRPVGCRLFRRARYLSSDPARI